MAKKKTSTKKAPSKKQAKKASSSTADRQPSDAQGSTALDNRTNVDREIAALQARIDQLRGAKLSRQQLRDVDWLQKSEREETIRSWVRAVPKRDYCQLSGRQHKLVDDAAATYELPLDGPHVDLQAALTALHDFIANNAYKLRSDLDETRSGLTEEKLRQQIVGLERDNEKKLIDLLYAKSRAIPKEKVQEALIWFSGRLQVIGGNLARIHPDARDTLNEFLEELAGELESGQLRF